MKVIFVGNGSSVKDYKAGSVIDEFDIVIRFNRGFLEGIDKYKEFVGSKTDIVVVHPGFIYPWGEGSSIDSSIKEWKWEEKIKHVNMKVMLSIGLHPENFVSKSDGIYDIMKRTGLSDSDFCYAYDFFRCAESFKYNKYFKDKWDIISIDAPRNLKNIVDFKDTWPSTGLCGIYYVADKLTTAAEAVNGSAVKFYSYGFDGADKKYKYYHYFNHTDKRTTEFHWRPDRKDHSLDAERECLDILKEQFNIKE